MGQGAGGRNTGKRNMGKLKHAIPIWYGVDGWNCCHSSTMDPEFHCIANCMSSLRTGFGLEN